jgi:leader peptidase (prepilin peptidase)/N-methyltransferase
MTTSLVTAATAKVADAVPAALVATTLGRATVTAMAGLVGLLIGSFLNVVVYRVPRRLSVVEPRSFCPHCDVPLRSIDNIPLVSWLVLGGRCRRCRGPISIRYPLVELATGVVFAALGWGLGPHWAVPGFCALAATLVALVAIERDGLAPPVSVAGIGTAVAAVLLVAAGVADRRWAHVVGLALGVVVSAAVVAVARRQGGHQPSSPPWTAAAPVLLPVGAALGWLGPVYVGEGLATAVIVVLGVRSRPRAKTSSSPSTVGSVLGLALAAGAGVATLVAVAVGAGAGT